MNLRTTLLMLGLAAGGGAGLYFHNELAARFGAESRPVVTGAGSAGTLAALAPDRLHRIEITHGDQSVVLERHGAGWTLPGGWPTRGPEVQELVALLDGL